MKTIRTITALLTVIIFCSSTTAQDNPFEVEVTGAGQPILLLPGFTCTKEIWKETVKELSKNYECHAFTFAGFGGLEPIETPWLPKIKDGLEAYIAKNNLKNSVIIGHSLGGTLALWLASDGNDFIEKIIVVDGLPATGALMIPDYNSENIAYDTAYNHQLLQMSDEDFSAMATQYASAMTLTEEKKEQIKNWIMETDRETYVYGYTDLLKLDVREDIANIKAKMLVLGAAQPFGKEMAMNTYKSQFEKASDYELKIAENSAHFIMFDDPEWMMAQINDFLTK